MFTSLLFSAASSQFKHFQSLVLVLTAGQLTWIGGEIDG